MYLIKEKTSPYYQIIYLKNGKRTKKTTKKKLKTEALQYLAEFEKNLVNEKRKVAISIKDFREEYEKYIEETKSKKYLRSVQLAFKMFIDFTGNVLLNDIDVKLVESFIQITYKRAKYSAGLYYRTLKAALTTALRWNYINANPFQYVKHPKLVSKLPLFITEEELQIILKNVTNTTIRYMIIISNDAGLRLAEVVNLKWCDIDLQSKILLVTNKEDFQTKSKKDRIIPLTNRLYSLFLGIAPNAFNTKDNKKHIFLNKNKVKYNLDYVSRTFKRAVRKAKLNEGYSYHSLRHSFASQLVQRGVSLYVVKELMGHQDIRTTQIYSHLEPKNLFEAVDKLNKQIQK